MCREEESRYQSVRYIGQVGLQLRHVEARRKPRIRRLRRQDRIRLIDALIPPGPGALLYIAPRQDGYAAMVVPNGKDRVAVTRQRARCPGLVGIDS
jgi:hypothetical protein